MEEWLLIIWTMVNASPISNSYYSKIEIIDMPSEAVCIQHRDQRLKLFKNYVAFCIPKEDLKENRQRIRLGAR